MKKLFVGLFLLVSLVLGYWVITIGVPYITLWNLSRHSDETEQHIRLHDEYLVALEQSIPDWVETHGFSCSFGDCSRVAVSVDMRGRDDVLFTANGNEIIRVRRKEEPPVEGILEESSYFEAYLYNKDGSEMSVDLDNLCYMLLEEPSQWQPGLCTQDEETRWESEIWVSFALGGIGTVDPETGAVTSNRDGFAVWIYAFGQEPVDESFWKRLLPGWVDWTLAISDGNERFALMEGMRVSRNNVVRYAR